MRSERLVLAMLLLILGASALWVGFSPMLRNSTRYGVIHADAQGYHGYLVATFLHGSFDWDAVIGPYSDTYFNGERVDFTVETEAGRVNKYFVGTAVMMLPQFVAACAIAKVAGIPVDGYSQPFQAAAIVGAVAYVLSGLWLLSLFLRSLNISLGVTAIVISGVYLGTGLLFYSTTEPAMSHAYSFFLFCAFIWSVHRLGQGVSLFLFTCTSIVTALVVLVRPSNGLIILSIPFILGGMSATAIVLRSVMGRPRLLLTGLLIGLAIMSLQPLVYFAQVGRMWIWSYGDEGFNFLSPHITDVLFSYRKGLFIYYPWVAVATLGFIPFLLKDKIRAIFLFLFLGVAVYVVSSWWYWSYGGSFGMRALIEYLPFVAVPMAFLLQSVSGISRFQLSIVTLLAIPVIVIQTYQYNRFILHWDQMDRDRYWRSFLQTGPEWEGAFYKVDLPDGFPDKMMPLRETVVTCDLEGSKVGWNSSSISTEQVHHGQRSALMCMSSQYGPSFSDSIGNLFAEGRKMIIAEGFIRSTSMTFNGSIAFSLRSGDKDWGHSYSGISTAQKNVWKKYCVTMNIDSSVQSNDQITIYPFQGQGDTTYVDDLKFRFITY